MSVPVIAFFNNKGGVGKTSLVYHVSWMMSELGLCVVAADLDPQSNLSTAFLEEEPLELLWSANGHDTTIFGAIKPLKEGESDVAEPKLFKINDRLHLLPGDMMLSRFEDDLSETWPKCLDGDIRAFRITSAFWRLLQNGARQCAADVVLVDLGPDLGAINRSAMVASDVLVIPLGPDLYSLQGLHNLGPTLGLWRKSWQKRLKEIPDHNLVMPQGTMKPIGYIVMQHSVRLDRPVKAYDKWVNRMPGDYREFVLNESIPEGVKVANDPHCFMLLKHYRSLMPMAQEVRKPIFHLKPADGALGAHTYAVQEAYRDFEKLSREIAKRAGIPIEGAISTE
ncbi:MAG: ParA family protein [Magnetococcales bacterium]|nr:ParA family protein [Magnetococcales bacterium]MBF0149156.1 ParA family protein [Magnetococcales bacterium]